MVVVMVMVMVMVVVVVVVMVVVVVVVMVVVVVVVVVMVMVMVMVVVVMVVVVVVVVMVMVMVMVVASHLWTSNYFPACVHALSPSLIPSFSVDMFSRPGIQVSLRPICLKFSSCVLFVREHVHEHVCAELEFCMFIMCGI